MKARARQEISNTRHPVLKRLRAALRAGDLTEDGCCGVEGRHLVEEALLSGLELVALVGTRQAEGLLAQFETMSGRAKIIHIVTERLFRTIAQTETPQGIAALVRMPSRRLEDCLKTPKALVVVAVGLQDPGNLGTILRSLEAFGGAACVLAQNTVSPYNGKAVRASSGSIFRVPVFRQLAADKILGLCRRHGLRAVGLAAKNGTPLETTDLKGSVALFVGQEGSGLPAELAARLDLRVTIRLTSAVDSLNAGVAASLALYEARRQRGWQ
ncbi:MAG: TrmH family RNA methyltransferase [Candidatus Acidiferrales bacterium]